MRWSILECIRNARAAQRVTIALAKVKRMRFASAAKQPAEQLF